MCIVLCSVVVAAGTTAFSVLRNPDDFLGNIDSMDTSDGEKCFYRAALYATRSFPSQWCPSVCHGVNCDKTKAPSEKSSIMTNRKSPTTLPMSLR